MLAPARGLGSSLRGAGHCCRHIQLRKCRRPPHILGVEKLRHSSTHPVDLSIVEGSKAPQHGADSIGVISKAHAEVDVIRAALHLANDEVDAVGCYRQAIARLNLSLRLFVPGEPNGRTSISVPTPYPTCTMKPLKK